MACNNPAKLLISNFEKFYFGITVAGFTAKKKKNKLAGTLFKIYVND